MNIPERITVEVADINHYHTVNNGGALATAIVSEVTATINQLVDKQIRSVINPETGETKPMNPGVPLGK